MKVILFVCEATCNAAKSQDCFQISAHVSLISEMLVAHHFSKISPELEMWDLRVSFEMRFYIGATNLLKSQFFVCAELL